MSLLAVMAIAMGAYAFSPSTVLGQSPVRAPVEGVTVAPGDAAGELRITWDAPSPAPNEYRVNWAPENEPFPGRRNPDGNAFPADPELTVTGLEAGGAYQVRVRARFGPGDVSPWSEIVYGTAADAAAIQAVSEAEPLVAAQQVGHTSPSTTDECGDLLYSGDAVYCTGGRFSVQTYYPDGTYSINWSNWASEHDNIAHFTVEHKEFQYRDSFKRADTDEPFNVDPALGDGFVVPGSCEAAVEEVDSEGNYLSYYWRCEGLYTVDVDTEGNPSSVVTDAENRLQAWWDGSLASPSRKHDVPVTAMRIPARTPTGLDDELTQAELDDTVELKASERQMLLFRIITHFDDETSHAFHTLIHGL